MIGWVLKVILSTAMVAYVAFLAWGSRHSVASLSWESMLILFWMLFTLAGGYRMGVLERKVDALLERFPAEPKR